MLYDKNGVQIEPIWYERGSHQVWVRYQEGEPVLLPVDEVTSPKGSAYVARVIRAVRVP